MKRKGHQEIMMKIVSRLLKSYKLTESQIHALIAANLASDNNQNRSAIHFDNCAFPEGEARIRRCWRCIFFEKKRFSAKSLRAFGRLLHTVQDFYSHSNWIERHIQDDPVPLWNLDPSSLPPGIYSGTWKKGEPKRCKPGTPDHDRLNKDSLESKKGKMIVRTGPHRGKSYYELAYQTACRASMAELKKFVAGIRNK